MPLDDVGASVELVRAQAVRHLAPPALRVRPRRPWTPTGTGTPTRDVARSTGSTGPAVLSRPRIPALLRGYLRLGAWICGEPAYDPEFNVADFYVLLTTDRSRWRRWRGRSSSTGPGRGHCRSRSPG